MTAEIEQALLRIARENERIANALEKIAKLVTEETKIGGVLWRLGRQV